LAFNHQLLPFVLACFQPPTSLMPALVQLSGHTADEFAPVGRCDAADSRE
jgi:hypothetical protein